MKKNEPDQEQRCFARASNTALVFFGYALLIYAIGAIGYVVPQLIGSTRRGFFCQDPSISLPYRSNTIEFWVVLTLCYFLTTATICLSELYLSFQKPRPQLRRSYTFLGRIVPPSVIRAIQLFLVSQVGFMITMWLYQLCKYSVGRLRPHFLDVCQPDTTDCVANTYVDTYVCLGTDAKKLKDARLSFFSGHCATSFYYATFISICAYLRLVAHRPTWVPAFLLGSVLLLSGATFVGVSRVFDNKHHPDDVLVGAIEGVLVACLTVFAFRHTFSHNHPIVEEEHPTSKSLSDISLSSATADSSA